MFINDGSTDKTDEIMREYVSRDEKIKYFNQKNQGTLKARLNGIKKCKGDYITFIDSEDYIKLDTLDIIMNNKAP